MSEFCTCGHPNTEHRYGVLSCYGCDCQGFVPKPLRWEEN